MVIFNVAPVCVKNQLNFWPGDLNSVPGCKNLAANLLAKAWNSAPQVRSAHTIGAAKIAARKWAKSLNFKA